MRMPRAALRAVWRIQSLDHGGTYSDAVTQQTREFDTRALAGAEPYRLWLAVECKVGRADRGEIVSNDAAVFDKWAQALSSADALAQRQPTLQHIATCSGWLRTSFSACEGDHRSS